MYAILSRLSAAVNTIAAILVPLVFFLGVKEVPLGTLGTMPLVQFLGLVLIVVAVVNVFAAAAGALAIDPKESDYHYDQGFSMVGLISYTITAIFVGIGMWMVDQKISEVMDVPIAVWVLGAFVLFGVFDVGVLQRGNRKWFRDQANARRQQQAVAAAAAAATAAAAANPPAGGAPAPAAAAATPPANAAAASTHVHSGAGWAAFLIALGLAVVIILALAFSNRGEFKKSEVGDEKKTVVSMCKKATADKSGIPTYALYFGDDC